MTVAYASHAGQIPPTFLQRLVSKLPLKRCPWRIGSAVCYRMGTSLVTPPAFPSLRLAMSSQAHNAEMCSNQVLIAGDAC